MSPSREVNDPPEGIVTVPPSNSPRNVNDEAFNAPATSTTSSTSVGAGRDALDALKFVVPSITSFEVAPPVTAEPASKLKLLPARVSSPLATFNDPESWVTMQGPFGPMFTAATV